MASPGRRRTRDLIAEVRDDGPRFRFFQAVRLLALAAEDSGDPVPTHVRFGTPLSLGFPASEIVDVQERPHEGTKAPPAEMRMTVGFMGMTGPSGALPTAYTELLIERRNHYRDTAAHRFLDLFSHRAISLFYQAWRKHRFYLPYEAGKGDRFSRNLLDLVGLGLTHLQERLQKQGSGIPDRFLIHYAGLLSQKPMSAANIAAVVRGYFGAKAHLQQYVGQWIAVPEDEQSSIGRNSCVLGESAFLGERMWDRQTKVRIELGPLSRQEFADFMPGGSGRAALRELMQFCLGHSLACDARLILKHDEVPPPILSGAAEAPAALGYNLWLNSRSLEHDPQDTEFRLI